MAVYRDIAAVLSRLLAAKLPPLVIGVASGLIPLHDILCLNGVPAESNSRQPLTTSPAARPFEPRDSPAAA